MRIAITGLGVVCAAGVGEEAFFTALDAGTSGIGHDADGLLTARIGEFGVKERIAAANLRRMPRLSQLAIVAAKEALAAAALTADPTRIGVVMGTGLGTLEETTAFMRGYLDDGPEAASPLLFPISVMNAPAGQLALECKLRGVNTTVNHRDASALSAVTLACDQLTLGRADALLVGGIDELSRPALHGYRRLSRLSSAGLRPYDLDRDGLAPGESAAILVLEREADARARGARIRAVLSGRGESGDDRPRIGWGHADAWPEAERAVAQAAATAGLSAQQISWVAGSGNGTSLDERELRTIKAGLRDHLPPVSSILGQTGECLSSGLLRLVAGVYALERQRLPGTTGLHRSAPEWQSSLVSQPRAARVEAVLCPSFSQGGSNVVLVLARA